MRVFVTGATGTIGGPVARAFRREGHAVLGLARSAATARRLAAREIRPVPGSLEEPELLARAAAECEVIVHAAADAGAAMFALDRAALETLLAAARLGPQPKVLVYTSGTWIYGDTGGRRADEAAPLQPPAYAADRIQHERRVLDADGIRGLVLRPGCVYGGRGSLTAMWFEGASKGRLEIVGDGSARWAMVHEDDLADAYVRAAVSGLSGEVFNVSEASDPTVLDMARAVARASGHGGEIRRLPVPEAVARFGAFAECLAYDQQLDSSKAERLLGWRPRHRGFAEEADVYFEAWNAGRES